MKQKSVRRLVFCSVFAALLAVLSQVQFPLPGLVPLSLATLGVMLCGLLLGWRAGTLAVAAYILLGAMGVPVFAGFRGGISALLGPTGGYIAGYLFYAMLSGLPAPALQRSFAGRCTLLLLGTAVCYALGTAWFIHATGRTAAESLSLCVLPFLPGDTAKILAAAWIAPRLRKRLALA